VKSSSTSVKPWWDPRGMTKSKPDKVIGGL
jgi:hypothetical protein